MLARACGFDSRLAHHKGTSERMSPFVLAIVAETVFFVGCNLTFHGNRFWGRFRPAQSVLAKFALELVGERSAEVGGGRTDPSFKCIFLL